MKTFLGILNTLLLAGILCVLIFTYRGLDKLLDRPFEIENARGHAINVSVNGGTVQVEPGSDPLKIDEPLQVTIKHNY